MERHGIVKKEVLNEPYRPVSYSLTDKGRKLATSLKN
jgi:DNA-binding HxlR family transcriptional regulator